MATTFNIFDLIFIAFAFIFIVAAFLRGFIKEIFSLIIWIISLTVSYFLAPFTAELIITYTHSAMVADLVSRVILFIFIFVVLVFSTSNLSDAIKEKMPQLMDRSLGVLYGIGKTLLIFGIAYSIIINLYGFLLGDKQDPQDNKAPDWLSEARCSGILQITSDFIHPAVDSFMSAITKNFDKLGFLPKTLDDKIDEVVDDKKIDADDAEKTSKQVEEDAGYTKKEIEKMNRLIDVIGK